MARLSKLDAQGIYVAFDSFAVDVADTPVSVKAGTRLRGDNPIVRAHPAMFCGPDADDAQVDAAKRAAYAEADASANASRAASAGPSMVAQPIPEKHRLEVTRDHVSWGSGAGMGISLHAGDLIDERDEIVRVLRKREPDLFRKPVGA